MFCPADTQIRRALLRLMAKFDQYMVAESE
jgi:hypothetical protein